MADTATRRTHAPSSTTSPLAAVAEPFRIFLAASRTVLAVMTTERARMPASTFALYRTLRRFAGPARSFSLAFRRG